MIPPNTSDADFTGNGQSHGSSAATLLVPAQNTLPAEPISDWHDGRAVYGGEPQQQGLNLLDYMRSLRRRWLLAICLSTALALAVMIPVFLWFAPPMESTAIIEVRPTPPAYLSERTSTRAISQPEREVIQNTEVRNVKSEAVLQAASRLPKVMATKLMQEHKDEPIKFLNDELKVGFWQRTNYMFVTLEGENPTELAIIVDAIVAAYKERYADLEKRELNAKILELKTVLGAKRDERRGVRTTLTTLTEETGVAKSEAGKAILGMLMDEFARLNNRHSEYERKAGEAITRAKLEQERLNQIKRRGVSDAKIEASLEKDQNFKDLKARALQIQQVARTTGAQGRGGQPSPGVVQAYQEVQRQLAEYRRDAGIQLKKFEEDSLAESMRQADVEARIHIQAAEKLKKDLEKMAADLKKKGRANEQLAEAEDSMARLDAYINEKQALLDNWELERKAQDRITFPQPAMTPQGLNSVFRYLITIGAGLLTFGAGVIFVGGWEYLKRRLGNVNEVSKELGLNLVGTVPVLPKRPGARVSRHLTASQYDTLLADSIDSIRATLIHGAGAGGHRTVMVTSAWDGEGKTTVASQLAASLAHCGRRTLLVDADLRNPTLHQLFEMPADVGLCEVLRDEIEPRAAVRETPGGNLWLLSTGNCDHRSIQALENANLGRIFAQLEAEYDFIIIDTAPVLAYADPLLIGQHVDGVILSVRLDYTQRPKVEEAISRLRGVGIHIFGAVVNGTKPVANRRAAEQNLLIASS